jgi:hypothetical protein
MLEREMTRKAVRLEVKQVLGRKREKEECVEVINILDNTKSAIVEARSIKRASKPVRVGALDLKYDLFFNHNIQRRYRYYHLHIN